MSRSFLPLALAAALAASPAAVTGALPQSGAARANPVRHRFPIVVPDDHPTLQAAIDAALAGDTIAVRTALQQESVTVDKPLTILGDPLATIRGPNCNLPGSSGVPAVRPDGPGADAVVLLNVDARSQLDCIRSGSGVAGTGFDELHVADSTVISGLTGFIVVLPEARPDLEPRPRPRRLPAIDDLLRSARPLPRRPGGGLPARRRHERPHPPRRGRDRLLNRAAAQGIGRPGSSTRRQAARCVAPSARVAG